VNTYGPTECTVAATSGHVPATAPPQKSALPAIGAPIANTFVYLLDQRFQPAKAGETGEMFIGGAGVARGYRNNASLTRQRFFEDPFRATPGRMYRTGDLASLLPSGQYAFHGRTDSQEEIRGHRVAPDEITSVLVAHPAVSAGAVAARASTNGEKQLVAYVVLKQGSEVTARDLREHLASTLPDYMIPSAFAKLESLPLNSNGKLDRAALPAPAPATAMSEADYRPPDTPIEVAVAQILRDLLDVRRVGLDDNFFLMGGHSLLGTQLVLRILDRFGVELNMRDLVEAQNVEQLAQTVERQVIEKLAAMSGEEAERVLAERQTKR